MDFPEQELKLKIKELEDGPEWINNLPNKYTNYDVNGEIEAFEEGAKWMFDLMVKKYELKAR